MNVFQLGMVSNFFHVCVVKAFDIKTMTMIMQKYANKTCTTQEQSRAEPKR